MSYLIKSVLKRIRLGNKFSLVSRLVFIVLINPCTNASFTLTNNSHFRFSHYCHDTYTPYRCLVNYHLLWALYCIKIKLIATGNKPQMLWPITLFVLLVFIPVYRNCIECPYVINCHVYCYCLCCTCMYCLYRLVGLGQVYDLIGCNKHHTA